MIESAHSHMLQNKSHLNLICAAGYGAGGYGRQANKGYGTELVSMYLVVLENIQCVKSKKNRQDYF